MLIPNVQSRTASMGLILIFMASPSWSQEDSSYVTGMTYEITVPSGCDFWVLSFKPEIAVGLEPSMCKRRPDRDKSEIEALFDGNPSLYPKFTKTTQVELVSNLTMAAVVKFTQADGSPARGWIAWSRIDVPPETSKRLQATREAAREAAKERRLEAEKLIASMPRIIGKQSPVLVASSMDCAKDLQKISAFTRLNGFGVEARKKTTEFIGMDCGFTLDVGTLLVGAEKDGALVKFIGTNSEELKLGIALAENVLWPGRPVVPALLKPVPGKAPPAKK
jgi:hypothetical protein